MNRLVLVVVVVIWCCADAVTDLNLQLYLPSSSGDGIESCQTFWDGEKCVLPLSYGAMNGMALIAAQQFNNRDGRWVSKFEELSGCDVRINVRVSLENFSPDVTVLNTLRMANDDSFKVHGTIGPATSSSAIAQSLINAALTTPQISYWSTSPELDRVDLYRYFMRTIPTDLDVADAICRFWIDEMKYKFGAVLYVNDGYGEAYKTAIINSCTGNGSDNYMNEIRSYPYSRGITSNIDVQVSNLANDKIQNILLVAQPGDLKLVVDAALKYNLFDQHSWVVSDGISTSDFNELPRSSLAKINGTIKITSQGGSDESRAWRQFKEDFRNLNISEYDGVDQFPQNWTRSAEQLYAQENLVELSEIRDVGAFLFDAVATFGIVSCKLESLLAEDCVDGASDPNCIFAEAFLPTAGNTTFEGLSGNVEFLENGNRKNTASRFEMGNIIFQEDGAVNVRSIGSKRGSENWSIQPGIIYSSGSLVQPSDVPLPEQDFDHSSELKGALYLLLGINLCLAFAAFGWTLYYRDHAIVKASQVPFLLTIGLGIVISSSSIFSFTVDDQKLPLEEKLTDSFNGTFELGSFFCRASAFQYSLGFTITFGALYGRLWRIRKLFKSHHTRVLVVPTWNLYLIILGLVLVDLSILLVWLRNSPLVFQRKEESSDLFGQATVSYGTCVQDEKIYLILIGLFHMLVLFGGNYFAWLCRKINSGFAESKYIAIYMASYLQLLLVSIPIMIIIANQATLLMFLKGVVVFLNDFGLMAAIWGPKLAAVHFGYRDYSGEGGIFFDTNRNNQSLQDRSGSGEMSTPPPQQFTYVRPSYTKPTTSTPKSVASFLDSSN